MANFNSLSIEGINLLLPAQTLLVKGGACKSKGKKKSGSRSGGSRSAGKKLKPKTGGTGAGGGTVTPTPPPVVIADQA
jgi:hypothetical protein